MVHRRRSLRRAHIRRCLCQRRVGGRPGGPAGVGLLLLQGLRHDRLARRLPGGTARSGRTTYGDAGTDSLVRQHPGPAGRPGRRDRPPTGRKERCAIPTRSVATNCSRSSIAASLPPPVPREPSTCGPTSPRPACPRWISPGLSSSASTWPSRQASKRASTTLGRPLLA